MILGLYDTWMSIIMEGKDSLETGKVATKVHFQRKRMALLHFRKSNVNLFLKIWFFHNEL